MKRLLEVIALLGIVYMMVAYLHAIADVQAEREEHNRIHWRGAR
jgi:hypothetical protein